MKNEPAEVKLEGSEVSSCEVRFGNVFLKKPVSRTFELPEPKAACKMIDPDNVKELVELLKNETKVI